MKDSKIVPGELNGFLDRNTSFEGELRFRDTLRLDGCVSGRIISDQVLMFDGGRVIESGPPERIFGDPEKERTREFLSAVL